MTSVASSGLMGKCVQTAAKTIIVDRKNRKGQAMLCLTSRLRPNAANSSDMYFNSIRFYASYAPVTRVTDAINMGVFPGKMCSDRHKSHGCGYNWVATAAKHCELVQQNSRKRKSLKTNFDS